MIQITNEKKQKVMKIKFNSTERLIRQTDIVDNDDVYEKQNPISRIILAARIDRFQQTLINYNGF